MKPIWFFDDVNLFKVLCPHKFKSYKKEHDFDAYKKKDYIYFTEDSANKVYLIEKGKVKIGYYTEGGEEVVKSILSRGELFGEKAILGEEIRNEFLSDLVAKKLYKCGNYNSILALAEDKIKYLKNIKT